MSNSLTVSEVVNVGYCYEVELVTPSGFTFVLCGNRDPGEVAAEMLLDADARIRNSQLWGSDEREGQG